MDISKYFNVEELQKEVNTIKKTIEADEQQIKETKDRIKASKSNIENLYLKTLITALSKSPENYIEIGFYFYWILSEEVKSATIEEALLKTLPLKNAKEAFKAIKKSASIELVCQQCQTTFYRLATSRNNQSIPNRVCEECKKKEEQGWQSRQNKIQERLHQLKIMPYQEYLQTEEWKETRLKALKRADFKCQVCNKSDKLNVHHRTYENRGNEQNKDLTVLCEDCHKLYHFGEESKNGRH